MTTVDPLAGTEVRGPEHTYVVEHFVGEGSMGRVYRGHEKASGDPGAIKFLQADATPERRDRFWFEQDILAELIRAGITCVPPVLEAQREGPAPFLVQAYVDIETYRPLDDLLREGPLDEGAALGLAEQALEMLHLLHTRVERTYQDMQLKNFRWNANRQELMVLDWNVVSLRLRDLQATLGEAEGRQAFEDGVANDLARFAAFFYRVLTGKAAEKRGETARALSRRAGKDWEGVSVAARQVVVRALHPDPLSRYASAEAFGMAIREVQVLWQADAETQNALLEQIQGIVKSQVRDRKEPLDPADLDRAVALVDMLERQGNPLVSRLRRQIDEATARVSGAWAAGKRQYESQQYARAVKTWEPEANARGEVRLYHWLMLARAGADRSVDWEDLQEARPHLEQVVAHMAAGEWTKARDTLDAAANTHDWIRDLAPLRALENEIEAVLGVLRAQEYEAEAKATNAAEDYREAAQAYREAEAWLREDLVPYAAVVRDEMGWQALGAWAQALEERADARHQVRRQQGKILDLLRGEFTFQQGLERLTVALRRRPDSSALIDVCLIYARERAEAAPQDARRVLDVGMLWGEASGEQEGQLHEAYERIIQWEAEDVMAALQEDFETGWKRFGRAMGKYEAPSPFITQVLSALPPTDTWFVDQWTRLLDALERRVTTRRARERLTEMRRQVETDNFEQSLAPQLQAAADDRDVDLHQLVALAEQVPGSAKETARYSSLLQMLEVRFAQCIATRDSRDLVHAKKLDRVLALLEGEDDLRQEQLCERLQQTVQEFKEVFVTLDRKSQFSTWVESKGPELWAQLQECGDEDYAEIEAWFDRTLEEGQRQFGDLAETPEFQSWTRSMGAERKLVAQKVQQRDREAFAHWSAQRRESLLEAVEALSLEDYPTVVGSFESALRESQERFDRLAGTPEYQQWIAWMRDQRDVLEERYRLGQGQALRAWAQEQRVVLQSALADYSPELHSQIEGKVAEARREGETQFGALEETPEYRSWIAWWEVQQTTLQECRRRSRVEVFREWFEDQRSALERGIQECRPEDQGQGLDQLEQTIDIGEREFKDLTDTKEYQEWITWVHREKRHMLDKRLAVFLPWAASRYKDLMKQLRAYDPAEHDDILKAIADAQVAGEERFPDLANEKQYQDWEGWLERKSRALRASPRVLEAAEREIREGLDAMGTLTEAGLAEAEERLENARRGLRRIPIYDVQKSRDLQALLGACDDLLQSLGKKGVVAAAEELRMALFEHGVASGGRQTRYKEEAVQHLAEVRHLASEDYWKQQLPGVEPVFPGLSELERKVKEVVHDPFGLIDSWLLSVSGFYELTEVFPTSAEARPPQVPPEPPRLGDLVRFEVDEGRRGVPQLTLTVRGEGKLTIGTGGTPLLRFSGSTHPLHVYVDDVQAAGTVTRKPGEAGLQWVPDKETLLRRPGIHEVSLRSAGPVQDRPLRTGSIQFETSETGRWRSVIQSPWLRWGAAAIVGVALLVGLGLGTHRAVEKNLWCKVWPAVCAASATPVPTVEEEEATTPTEAPTKVPTEEPEPQQPVVTFTEPPTLALADVAAHVVPAVTFAFDIEDGALDYTEDKGLGVKGADSQQWYAVDVEVRLDDAAEPVLGRVSLVGEREARWKPDLTHIVPLTAGNHSLVVMAHVEDLRASGVWEVPFAVPPLPLRVTKTSSDDTSGFDPPPLLVSLEDGDDWELQSDKEALVLRGPRDQEWHIVPEGDQVEHLKPEQQDDRQWKWVWAGDEDFPAGDHTVTIMARQDEVEELVGEVAFSIDKQLLVIEWAVEEGVQKRYFPPLSLTTVIAGWSLGVQGGITPTIRSTDGPTETIEILVDDKPWSGSAVYDDESRVLWYPDVSVDYIERLGPGTHKVAVRMEDGNVVAVKDLEIAEPLTVTYEGGDLCRYPQPECDDEFGVHGPDPGTGLEAFAKLQEDEDTYLLLQRTDTGDMLWAVLSDEDTTILFDGSPLTADTDQVKALLSLEVLQIPSPESLRSGE